MSLGFRLPRDGTIFTDAVFTRSLDFITYGIWEGIEPIRLKQWFKNFKTDEEKYFAACVLDSVIYRSDRQVFAILNQLFQRTLPDYTRLHPTPIGSISNFTERLKEQSIDPGIRLVPVVKSDDKTHKSGHVISRYIKRKQRFNPEWIIKANEIQTAIARGVQVFIFIDDFVGTGDQFRDFLRHEGLDSSLNSVYAVYAPMIAHKKGIEALKSLIHITTVEVLGSQNEIFHENSHTFDDGENCPDDAKEFYYELLESRGIAKNFGSDRRGYGHLELAFAFQHAAPDNSLPIFWLRENNWVPLFDR